MIEHLENGVRTSIKVFNTIADLLLECRDALSNFVQYKGISFSFFEFLQSKTVTSHNMKSLSDFVAEIDVSLNELRRLTEEAEIRLNCMYFIFVCRFFFLCTSDSLFFCTL
jgi:hypothetical protein